MTVDDACQHMNNADGLWRDADTRATMACREHDMATCAGVGARHAGATQDARVAASGARASESRARAELWPRARLPRTLVGQPSTRALELGNHAGPRVTPDLATRGWPCRTAGRATLSKPCQATNTAGGGGVYHGEK